MAEPPRKVQLEAVKHVTKFLTERENRLIKTLQEELHPHTHTHNMEKCFVQKALKSFNRNEIYDVGKD